jgi:hypothetical protein
LISYLSFLRRKVALDRYVLLVEILYASRKKPSNKTKEYLRIYTEMVGHCDELLKLPNLDAKLKSTYEVKREFLKAKCTYHKARSFVDLGEQVESTLLFDRALERTQKCGELLKQAKYAEESAADLKKLEDDINTAKQEMADIMAAYDKTKEDEKTAAFDALPKPAPVKPSFFDLALKHLKVSLIVKFVNRGSLVTGRGCRSRQRGTVGRTTAGRINRCSQELHLGIEIV